MFAVAKHAKNGKTLFFGPENKGAPWHRNADTIKTYRTEEAASSVAARSGGWVTSHDDARWNCGERIHCADMIG